MSIERMRCVMRHREGREAWAARAEGCERYGYGRTPDEAMAAALTLLAEFTPLPRRRGSPELAAAFKTLLPETERRSLFDENEIPARRKIS